MLCTYVYRAFVLRGIGEEPLATYGVGSLSVLFRDLRVGLLKYVVKAQAPPREIFLIFPKNLDRTISYLATCRENAELMHILANAVKENMKVDFIGPES